MSDTMSHKDEMSYFRLCRRTDPTFTRRDAVIEYLNSHKDEAEDIARQYWMKNNDDEWVMENGEMWDRIGSMDPEDAFRLGQMSERVIDADYVRYDGYGNLEDATYTRFDLYRYACEEACDGILDGEYEISKNLEEVIGIWSDPRYEYEGDDDEVMEPYVNYCRKSPAKRTDGKKAPAKKSNPKKPASKSGGSKGTASANRKLLNRYNAKKAPAKKKSSGKKR